MPVIALLGAQWGDEGKGKVSARLCEEASMCARFQGGPNAGHTVYMENRPLVFRSLPAGLITCEFGILGNGVVINPRVLLDELKALSPIITNIKKRTLISSKAHLILPQNIEDESEDIYKQIQTTQMGIGPTYRDKSARSGLRVEGVFSRDTRCKYPLATALLLEEFADTIGGQCIDTVEFLRLHLDKGAQVVAEGAQGALLDIDHGTYPYVTSCNTTIGAVLTGLGIGPKDISATYLVVSIYMTKVGAGPFAKNMDKLTLNHIYSKSAEVDSVTNKRRACAWLNISLLRQAVRINNADGIILTRLDVLTGLDYVRLTHPPLGCEQVLQLEGWTDQIAQPKVREDLPSNLQRFLDVIEKLAGAPIVGLSFGLGTDAYIDCRKTSNLVL